MPRLIFVSILIATLITTACAPMAPAPASTVPADTTTDATTTDATTADADGADLTVIKSYLLDQVAALKEQTAALKAASDGYYELAKAANFDYAALWENNGPEVSELLQAAKTAWVTASPLYEGMEGIVAGVSSLSEYDVILDAGAAGSEDPENAVPFDLTLPDGRVLEKPGNLFGVTESTLYGTYPEFTIATVAPDLDGNGTVDFGEALPDAAVLKAGADALDSYAAELQQSAQAWEPTESDAFTALVVMIPTMSEYFNSWKNSRFVTGEESTQRDFVAISRLADIQGILGGLQIVYGGVKPLVTEVEADQATQIEQGLNELKAFVADVYTQEQDGKRFSPEEADLLGAEAQNRATALAGQIAEVAAQLNISVE